MTTINNSENLIEKVGGIERAIALEAMLQKHAVPESWKISIINGMWHRSSVGFTHSDLRTAIAKHDEFKVGDLVCFIDSKVMFPDGETKTNELFKVIRSDGLGVDLTEIGKLKVYKTWVGDLRHATPSEIKAGHRLEAERHG
ncbi:hypothetical protein [Acinetobacter guillouiae]|uniref:hypothetical protein n=1 Tax=Acinetobacter guillouiae TaxID=106649 RepID=UPI003AF6C007